MFKISVGEYEEQKFFCAEDENLLAAARKSGQKIMRGCCSGGCGVCKIKIEEGEFRRETCSIAVLPAIEREENYSLACKTYPLSDLRITLIE